MSLSTGVNVPSGLYQLFAGLTPAQMNTMVQTAAHLTRNIRPNDVQQSKNHGTAAINTNPKATRPLNSWIAFRSYYSVLFASLQQKEISGFLTYLWQTDPFKAKWSILAKAYSIIRDSKGKGLAPLDQFLVVNGPYIKILTPTEYLPTLGWEVVLSDEGYILRRDYDISTLSPALLTSNVSVADIIQHSYDCGYITEDGTSLIIPGSEPAMMMASTVQETSSTFRVGTHTQTYAATSQRSRGETMSLKQDSEKSTKATASMADAVGEPGSAMDFDIAAERSRLEEIEAELLEDDYQPENVEMEEDDSDYSSLDGDDEAEGPASHVTANEIETEGSALDVPENEIEADVNVETGSSQAIVLSDQQQTPTSPMSTQGEMNTSAASNAAVNPVSMLGNMNFSSEEFYPYNQEFQPENLDISFDPFTGEEHNSFNMSEYVNEEMFGF